MGNSQAGILLPPPALARYMVFSLRPDTDPRELLQELAVSVNAEERVIGFGASLVKSLGAEVEGLDIFPSYAGASLDVPSTPAALWCWLRGNDRGELVHASREVERLPPT